MIAVAALGHNPRAIRDAGASLGAWEPIAYIVLCVVLTLALFPYPVQAAAAGLLFGVAEGTGYAILAGTVGAMAAFGIARRFGRLSVDALAGPRLSTYLDRAGRSGFAAVLFIRLLPGVPRHAASYLCGLTPVGLRPFTAGTLVGIAPYAYIYVVLGGSIGGFGSRRSLIVIGGFTALGTLALALLTKEEVLTRIRRKS